MGTCPTPNASPEALPTGESSFGFSPALPLTLSDRALAAADELIRWIPIPSGPLLPCVRTDLAPRVLRHHLPSRRLAPVHAKFGERARTLMLTQEAAEQATRPVIAHYRADRLARVPGLVADLGCGIGSDTAVYAAARGSAVAVELDPLTASFAAANLAFCPRARVYSGDVTAYDPANAAGTEAPFPDGAGASPPFCGWTRPAASCAARRRRRRSDCLTRRRSRHRFRSCWAWRAPACRWV